MSAVFADTFYFLALLNEDDKAHAMAVRWAANAPNGIVTTAFVLLEVADAMSDRAERSGFLRLYHLLRSAPDVTIVPATQDVLDQGLALYADRADKDWSLTDCVSFVVMRHRGLTEALTGDHHFEQAGFVALLA